MIREIPATIALASVLLVACQYPPSSGDMSVPSANESALLSDRPSNARFARDESHLSRTANGGSSPSEPFLTDLDDVQAMVPSASGSEGRDTLPEPPPGRARVGTGPAGLAAEAERELKLMVTSDYTHETFIDESRGEFDYDCSGFVGYALEAAQEDAFIELSGATRSRPRAKDYETFFSDLARTGASDHWIAVRRIVDLVPGDIVAWLRPSDAAYNDTGHVIIVRGTPVSYRSRADAFIVPVTDSTEAIHGSSDSRAADGSTGLGTGNIVLLANSSGAPTGYKWSTWLASVEESTAVSMGRLVP